MRSDWIPLSAAALVIGMLALVFGALLNPTHADATAAETMRIVAQDGGRWLAMSVLYFGASVALTLGLPAILSLFTTGGRRLGLFAVAVFSIGVIGTSGYSMLLVFFRAMVKAGAIEDAKLEQVTNDHGLSIFFYGWISGLYLGLLLLAVALFLARKTAVWVPVLLVVVVALFPVAGQAGKVGQALLVMGLAVAFTGIAIASVNEVHHKVLVGPPGY